MNNEEQRILDIKVKYEDAIAGIVEYQKKIDELAVSELKLKAQMKNAPKGENLEPYRKQLVAVKEATKEYRDNIRVLSKEIQNNLKQEQGHKDSLRAMRAELSNCTKEYDNMSKAERQGARGKELQKHINDITTELKRAEAETQRYYRNVGNYYGSIMDAMEDLQHVVPLGGGALKDFGGTVAAMAGQLDGIIPKIKAFGTTLLSLMGNPVFLALAGVVGAGAAFKWFYDYNKGLLQATRLTKEFTGFTGKEMKGLRNEILATADVYGKDFKEVLEGVDTLMAQYSISAQDALKVVQDGFQSGADLNGDMLNKIKQYAPVFHDAGIAADEFVAILQQTRSGIFSDKVLDLISMASKRIREMSTATAQALDDIGMSSKQVEKDLQSGAKSTFDIIQEISARLKEMPQDSQVVGNVLKDVFGKQGASGGLKMIESLSEMTTKMEEVKETTGEYGKRQQELVEAQKELNDVTAGLFDVTDKGFGAVIGNVKIFTTRYLADMLKSLVKGVNWFIRLYNESMVFRGAIATITTAFKGLWNVVRLVFNLIIDQVKGVGRAFKGLADMIEGVLTFDPKKIVMGFNEVRTTLGKTAKEMFTDFKQYGKDTAQAYIDGYNQTIKGGKVSEIDISSANGGSRDFSGDVGMSGGGKSVESSASKAAKNKAAKEAEKEAEKLRKEMEQRNKKEQEEMQKAENLLLQIIRQGVEERKKVIENEYNHQIETLERRLRDENNLTEKAREAMNSQMESLAKIRDRKLMELDIQAKDEEIQREQRNIEMILSTVRKGNEQEYNLKVQKIENERQLALDAASLQVMTEEEKQREVWAINQKYDQMQKELDDEMTGNEVEAIEKRMQERLVRQQIEMDTEVEMLRTQIDAKKQILEEMRQYENESDEDYLLRKAQLEKEVTDLTRKESEARTTIKETEMKAIAEVMGGVSDVLEAFGEENEGLAKAAKFLSLAQIAINTGVAISEGTKAAAGVPYPGNLAAIASTIATVLANVATAVKTVKSAKFAEGGDVIGSGTSTSDSINARLSNGESVLTAKATSMFAPALSAFNQMGGGVPIMGGGTGSQMGEEFLANAVARGMALAPRPVVSVEEIDKVRNRVSMINQIGVVE